jgi:hypothetical protein
MYYADLTSYEYLPDCNEPNALNVGWLDNTHPYLQGETSREFHDRLFQFCLSHVNLTRGWHMCNFCGFFGPVMRRGQEAQLGSAEIRVVYGDEVYAAPDLIYHYVVEHRYRPPEEFIQAVLEGPLPGSPEYEAVKKERDWE